MPFPFLSPLLDDIKGKEADIDQDFFHYDRLIILALQDECVCARSLKQGRRRQCNRIKSSPQKPRIEDLIPQRYFEQSIVSNLHPDRDF
jgi:hypothetical protein